MESTSGGFTVHCVRQLQLDKCWRLGSIIMAANTASLLDTITQAVT